MPRVGADRLESNAADDTHPAPWRGEAMIRTAAARFHCVTDDIWSVIEKQKISVTTPRLAKSCKSCALAMTAESLAKSF